MDHGIAGMSEEGEGTMTQSHEEMTIDPVLLGAEGVSDLPQEEHSTEDAPAQQSNQVTPVTAATTSPHVISSIAEEDVTQSSSAAAMGGSQTNDAQPFPHTLPVEAPPKGKRWILVSDTESDPQSSKKQRKKRKKTVGSDGTSNKAKEKKKRGRKRKPAGSDGEEAAQPPPKPYGRRPLIAKEAKWKDIPDWGDRTDCPLLKLPGEILDLCFGFGPTHDVGLSCRDYVALAGVSRFFRQQLTNDVFQEILHQRSVIYSPKPKTSYADRIFTTITDDWHDPPKRQMGPSTKPDHWFPRAAVRSQWSEAHYIVYKEEQAVWRNKRKQCMDRIRDSRLKDSDWEKAKKAETVEVNLQSRKIIAYVKGRTKGQPPPKKDTQGIPEDAVLPERLPNPIPQPRYIQRALALENHAQKQPEELSEHAMSRVTARAMARAKKAREQMVDEAWIAPDSEYETDEEGLDDPSDMDINDLRVSEHYWASKYRYLAAEEAKRGHIIKADAMRIYKVSEAELLCLRHSLVPNPMNGKGYLRSAVEALAWRSHGGPIGHRWHLEWVADKMAKISETRKANIEKAKQDGTFVQKKKKHQIRPFDWKYRNKASFVDVCDDENCDCHDPKQPEQGAATSVDGQGEGDGEGDVGGSGEDGDGHGNGDEDREHGSEDETEDDEDSDS
ncbi:hypothetical protein IAU59_001040 [Kwoniella sp. CBS 9459]